MTPLLGDRGYVTMWGWSLFLRIPYSIPLSFQTSPSFPGQQRAGKPRRPHWRGTEINRWGGQLATAPLWYWWDFSCQWKPITYLGFPQCPFSLTWSPRIFPPSLWRNTWRDSGACYTFRLIARHSPSLLHDYALIRYSLSCHQHSLLSYVLSGGMIGVHEMLVDGANII